MYLKELIRALNLDLESRISSDFPVKGLSCDSRRIEPGFVFVAVKGNNADGKEFILEAVKKGAKAVVLKSGGTCSVQIKDSVVFIEVPDERIALAGLAAAFYEDPSSRMKVVGVTGTNGKTTITYLLEAILKECGFIPGVIGTINCRFQDKVIPSLNTTPGPVELQSLLDRMFKSEVAYALMEVSSHALDQERTAKIGFSAAIFTNLTQDHLDYHQNLEDYFLAKAKLFTNLSGSSLAVVNVDDPYGLRLKGISKGRVVTYGIDRDCDIRAIGLKMDQSSSEFRVQTKNGKDRISSGLIGRHNVYNILAALAWAQEEKLDPAKVNRALERFSLVPGRLERFSSDKGFSVFVDYAHTEDALKNVLIALKQIQHKRIIVVFGCGGQRDKTKRPKMGKVVSELADYAIITNDNPRAEEPGRIIEDILSGISKDNFCVIPERLEAIKRSLALAEAGDIVLVAGKGHEDYQVLKDKTLHFDDREAVKQCLQSRN